SDVARLDRAGGDGLEAGVLGVEDARGAAVALAVDAADLHHAALGSDVAPEDDHRASLLQWAVEWPDHFALVGERTPFKVLGDCFSSDGHRFAVDESSVEQHRHHSRHAPGAVEVHLNEAAARLEV